VCSDNWKTSVHLVSIPSNISQILPRSIETIAKPETRRVCHKCDSPRASLSTTIPAALMTRGRPRGSKNTPGHRAGGSRAESGRKPQNPGPQKSPKQKSKGKQKGMWWSLNLVEMDLKYTSQLNLRVQEHKRMALNQTRFRTNFMLVHQAQT